MPEEILQRLKETVNNPGLYNGLTPEEQAQLFLFLFTPKKEVVPVVRHGKDGLTPTKDVDYPSFETIRAQVEELSSKTKNELESIVKTRLDAIKPRDGKDGRDAVITDEFVTQVAELASSLITLPDFPTLLTAEPTAIRDSLELLQGEERLSITAIEGLDDYEEIAQLAKEPRVIIGGGGISENKVNQLIEERLGDIGDVEEGVTGLSSPQVLARTLGA